MSIPSYTPNYPPDGSSLGNTKVIMRNNSDGQYQVMGIDHRTQNQSNPGYHSVIHQQTQTSVNTVSGTNLVFSGSPNSLIVNGSPVAAIPNSSDTQLYSLTGGGGLSQLTGNHQATNGFFWSSGMLIQFGFVPGTHTANNFLAGGDNGSINFNNNPSNYIFPNGVINIFPSLTFLNNPSSTGGVATVTFKSLTTGGVNWFYSSNSTSTYNGFYWVAIGY